MRIERIESFHLGFWAGPEDALWLEIGWWSVKFGFGHWDWVDRGGQWGISVINRRIWWNWADASYPPRRYGLPFLGRP